MVKKFILFCFDVILSYCKLKILLWGTFIKQENKTRSELMLPSHHPSLCFNLFKFKMLLKHITFNFFKSPQNKWILCYSKFNFLKASASTRFSITVALIAWDSSCSISADTFWIDFYIWVDPCSLNFTKHHSCKVILSLWRTSHGTRFLQNIIWVYPI